MTTIQIELCKEDRERLDKIIEALTSKIIESGVTTQAVAKKATKKKIESQSAPAVEEPTTPEVKEEPKAEPTFKPTMEDIQKAVMALANSGDKAKARAIVLKYATNVTAIKESDFVAAYTDLHNAINANQGGAQ